MGKVKVLIVDDSAFMRKLISEFLAEDSRGLRSSGLPGMGEMP